MAKSEARKHLEKELKKTVWGKFMESGFERVPMTHRPTFLFPLEDLRRENANGSIDLIQSTFDKYGGMGFTIFFGTVPPKGIVSFAENGDLVVVPAAEVEHTVRTPQSMSTGYHLIRPTILRRSTIALADRLVKRAELVSVDVLEWFRSGKHSQRFNEEVGMKPAY